MNDKRNSAAYAHYEKALTEFRALPLDKRKGREVPTWEEAVAATTPKDKGTTGAAAPAGAKANGPGGAPDPTRGARVLPSAPPAKG